MLLLFFFVHYRLWKNRRRFFIFLRLKSFIFIVSLLFPFAVGASRLIGGTCPIFPGSCNWPVASRDKCFSVSPPPLFQLLARGPPGSPSTQIPPTYSQCSPCKEGRLRLPGMRISLWFRELPSWWLGAGEGKLGALIHSKDTCECAFRRWLTSFSNSLAWQNQITLLIEQNAQISFLFQGAGTWDWFMITSRERWARAGRAIMHHGVSK